MENTEIEIIEKEQEIKNDILNTTSHDPSSYGYRIDYEGIVLIKLRYVGNSICKTSYSKFIKLKAYNIEEEAFDFEIPKDHFHKRRHKKQNAFYQLSNLSELRIRHYFYKANFGFSDLGPGALKMLSKITKQLTFSSIKFSSKSLSLLFTSIVSLKNLNLEQCTLDLSHLRLPIKREIGLEAMTIWECFFTQDEPKMSMEDLEILLKFLANHQFGKLRLLTLQNHHFGFFDLKKSMIKCLGITSKLKVDIPKPKKFGHNAFGCVVF
ncbi:unnamed protein product [Moneuplotes crassus]|uniref:Uncharacterized protein n=1 Tax=Euplotes crassus TaxID=5936 RepID=A0AAD1XHS4_EUPCR|nr:unnamed protein product [Moneuplotes crassus]